jgi:predicted phosphodiesterase
MRLYVVSDLHNEFAPFDVPHLDPSVDLVILAGDIDKKGRGVKWANETFQCPVAYILGNHELYDGHVDRTLQKMKDAAQPHVHVLENSSVVINGVRILGTTGWTDFTTTGNQVAASATAWEVMNDFKYIRIDAGYRRLRPADLIIRNHAAKAWLTKQLAVPFVGKTIVVTHHAPSSVVAGTKHFGHLNAAYANDWPALIAQADLWVFGHTHEAVDVELAGCRLVSNPRGYPNDTTGFDALKTIEL